MLKRFNLDYLLLLFIPLLFALIIIYTLRYSGENQFVYLADAFNHGQLHFREMPGSWLDTAEVDGRKYWVEGPFPAMFLMPFVALMGTSFLQAYLQIGLIVGSLGLFFKLCRNKGFSVCDSLWLVLAIALGSVFINIAFVAWSWQFAQAVTVFFSTLAVFLYFFYRRWWIIGLCVAVLFGTRFTAGFIILFFLGLAERKHWLKLLLPTIISGFFLLVYNYTRFGNLFDGGYQLANHQLSVLLYARDKYSLLGVENIPTNLYYYFIKGPVPVIEPGTFHLKFPYFIASPWGLSFFIVSPLFIKVLTVSYKDKIIKLAGLASSIILLIMLVYRFPGFRQLGPRYTLDFYPLLFILLLESFRAKKILRVHKLVILVSIVTNLYLFRAVY